MVILILDDDVDARQSLSALLSRRGHTAIEAPDAGQALELLDYNRDIDAVISDVRMPDLNGFDFLRVVKVRYPDMKVVLISGQQVTHDDVVPKGTMIIPKPLRLADLLVALY